MSDTIKLAVVIGGHPYNVAAFRELVNGIELTDVYIQDLDSWAAAAVDERSPVSYDVVLFYNMNYWDHLSIRDDMDERITSAISRLDRGEQGIIVLHHALLSFNGIPAYAEVCRIQNRRIRGFGQEEISTRVVAPDHPITSGLEDWTMYDEYFEIDPPTSAAKVLLETTNEKGVRQIAWVSSFGQARVFCYQSGHGPSAYADPSFRQVLARGVRWAARRL